MQNLANLSNEASEMPPCSQEWLETFVKVMALLTETFHGEISPLATVSYRRALSDLSPKELKLACDHALKVHREFMPTPAQLRGYLREAREALAGTRKPTICERCCGTGWYLPAGKDEATRCRH